jgi:hypothetical protein
MVGVLSRIRYFALDKEYREGVIYLKIIAPDEQ